MHRKRRRSDENKRLKISWANESLDRLVAHPKCERMAERESGGKTNCTKNCLSVGRIWNWKSIIYCLKKQAERDQIVETKIKMPTRISIFSVSLIFSTDTNGMTKLALRFDETTLKKVIVEPIPTSKYFHNKMKIYQSFSKWVVVFPTSLNREKDLFPEDRLGKFQFQHYSWYEHSSFISDNLISLRYPSFYIGKHSFLELSKDYSKLS